MNHANPTLLAFDCSGASCSAAVLRDGAIRAERFEAMQRGQAEALLPMIQSVMADAGIGFHALDAIVTTIGPGSFTGLRIGIAAARGLALAAEKPTIGLTSFEAVYGGLDKHRRVLPTAIVIDSKRGPLFTQLFAANGEAATEPASIEPQDLAAWLREGPMSIAGDGISHLTFLRDIPHITLSDEPDLVHAGSLALGARSKASSILTPLYLRSPDVTKPKNASGLIRR